MAARDQELVLTKRFISRKDVLKAAREIEQLRDRLIADRVRGKKSDIEPSEGISALMEANKVETVTPETLDELKKKIEFKVDRLPMLRFIFSDEPDSEFMARLVTWLRVEVHPAVLVMYSVQQQIAGGYILTTDHRRYDHSWRGILTCNPLKLGEVLRSGG